MSDGQGIVVLARQHLKETYKLGAQVTFENPNHKGPWDCAEFTTWVVYQTTNMLIGCRPRRPSGSEAYTGFWLEDANEFGLEIPWRDALKIPGAMVCRRAVSQRIGHIAISAGDREHVVEAAGTGLGVREHTALGRPWDIGIRIPDAAEWQMLMRIPPGGTGRIFRASEPPGPASPDVELIQRALAARGIETGPIDGVFGAWTEKAIAQFQDANGLIVDGIVGRQTGQALGLDFWGVAAAPVVPPASPASGSPASGGSAGAGPAGMPPAPPPGGVYSEKYDVTFTSLVEGGFYSFDPDNTNVKRAIRTNNPGALNVRPWQEKFPGYAGATGPDNSADKNRTTIYRTPEHGIGAWYHLLVRRYGYGPDGVVRVGDLARRYAGSELTESDPKVQAYVTGWRRFSNNKLAADSLIRLNELDDVVTLARGMFGHETGKGSPLSEAQIRYAVLHYRNDDLPS